MIKNSILINNAVINFTRDEIFDYIIRYLHKFNIGNITILKRKSSIKFNKKILRNYKIKFKVINVYYEDNLYDILKQIKKLPHYFFLLDTNSF